MTLAALTIDAGSFKDVNRAMRQLSGGQVRGAIRDAINRTGTGSYRAVVRTVTKENGFKRQKDVRARFAYKRASVKSLQWSAKPSGRNGAGVPLRDLKPKQTSAGVSYTVAGKTETRRSAFVVKKLNGHVFKRVSRSRLPISKQYDADALNKMLNSPAVQSAFKNAVLEQWNKHWPSRMNSALARAKRRNRL
ncbi:MAG: hypothetical protein ABJO09_01070 [Hyphomicrobiales bacterium]